MIQGTCDLWQLAGWVENPWHPKPFYYAKNAGYLLTITMVTLKVYMGRLKRILLLGLGLLLLGLNAPARTVPDPTDATGFFTTVADKLLRSTFPFGITNIPVLSNSVFIYTPAVQRLLQVAANLRDASTTNFYPTVFRPIFYRDAQGNVFISGYQQVASVTDVSDPQLTLPLTLNALSYGVSSNINIYGVPWIIGAKKGFPAFDQFDSRNDVSVTRKIQVSREEVVPYTAMNAQYFHTNQGFVMGITNHLGVSFWNSYSNGYTSPVLKGITVAENYSINMWMTNAARIFYQGFNTNILHSLNVWPGSQWNLATTPNDRQPNPASFLADNIDFPFLPLSVYLAGTATFEQISANTGVFDTSAVPPIYPFPPFTLITSNLFQAYIFDQDTAGVRHVIDYVQFECPGETRNINSEIQDYYSGANNSPYQQWYTNASGIGGAGPPLGFMNQIAVSKIGPTVAPANSWMASPDQPPATATPAGEAAFFEGFFTVSWNYNAKAYQNTNLAIQAPYVPTRVTYDYTLRQANDPFVHYLLSDLTETTQDTGINHSDDLVNRPLPSVTANLTQSGNRYQPWGINTQLEGIVGVLHNSPDNASYNLAYRDPLVWSSDDWNFPATNSLPLATLGRVHRGTPWQTIYLKSTNLLEYVAMAQANPLVGINTWEYWTGDFNYNDASIFRPITDWKLAALLTEMFNTNDASQLQSVNAPGTGVTPSLDGIVALTNSTASPTFSLPPELDPQVMHSNSPQAQVIASALAQMRATYPAFNSFDYVLATSELSIASPWLNTSGQNRSDYDIPDEAYEAIPSQLLPRLRPDSTGTPVFTNGGWRVRFSGSDAFSYQVQSSTNLVDWQNLGCSQPVQGTFDMPVSAPPDSSRIFYRSRLLP